MTYAEVIDEIDAYNRRRKSDYEDQRVLRAEMDYRLGGLIRIAFNDPKKYPATVKAAYPDIFKDDPAKFDWQDNKRSWAAYAAEFNRQKGGGAS